VYFVFALYVILAIATSVLLIDPTRLDVITETLIIIMFPLTNIGFLFIGLLTILDISKTMKNEYETIKNELEFNDNRQ
jgi:hypothetical protein